MALFIRDEAVDALAEELKAVLNAPSKKDAVKRALEGELRRVRQKQPLIDRLEDIWKRIDAMGPSDPNFDMKKFTDEMWGDD